MRHIYDCAAHYYICESWAKKSPKTWFVVGHVGATIGAFRLFGDVPHIKAAFPQKYKDLDLFLFLELVHKFSSINPEPDAVELQRLNVLFPIQDERKEEVSIKSIDRLTQTQPVFLFTYSFFFFFKVSVLRFHILIHVQVYFSTYTLAAQDQLSQ